MQHAKVHGLVLGDVRAGERDTREQVGRERELEVQAIDGFAFRCAFGVRGVGELQLVPERPGVQPRRRSVSM